jgi:hypothetical protein
MNRESILELLADHQRFHSTFQIDYFITAESGGTVYGMYKQALRELDKRYRGLFGAGGLLHDREDLTDELAELGGRWWTRISRRRHARVQRQLRRKEAASVELDQVIHDSAREFLRFYQQATALKEQIGELTHERRDELDRDMWRHRLKKMAALDIAVTGVPSSNTLEAITATPLDWRTAIWTALLGWMAEPPTAAQWLHDYESPMPALPNADVSEAEVAGLLSEIPCMNDSAPVVAPRSGGDSPGAAPSGRLLERSGLRTMLSVTEQQVSAQEQEHVRNDFSGSVGYRTSVARARRGRTGEHNGKHA